MYIKALVNSNPIPHSINPTVNDNNHDTNKSAIVIPHFLTPILKPRLRISLALNSGLNANIMVKKDIGTTTNSNGK